MASVLGDLLSVLTGRGSGTGWIEMRYRHARGMRCRFYPARGGHRALAQRVALLGATRDVYLGCALRVAQYGDRDHVAEVWTLWAECDGPDARSALDAFELPPTLLVASGTPGHVHAYWALTEPLDRIPVEEANRRLAEAVEGDPVCYDAARILRPPGTLNHKHAPPLPVRQIGPLGPSYAACEVLARLPAVPASPVPPVEPRAEVSADALLTIRPEEYVPALTGQPLGRNRKVSCPFHQDRTPSLHAYSTAERGWYCFGCGRGGSIYDLAAELCGLGTRGSDFLELKQRLTDQFAGSHHP
jgi:hypothetical protein